ncbi:MAG: D-aminoacylase [Chthonomonadales bacterium]
MEFDLIIRGGMLFDGTGEQAIRADIGVVDGKIVRIGDLTAESAGVVVDATGKHVSPGFIDIHTHSDISALYHPDQESIVSQGVTTQIVGNCSLCLGLATESPIFHMERRWVEAYGATIDWDSVDGHFQRVSDTGISTNYVMLAGQGTLRKRVMDLSDQPPTEQEMSAMKKLLDESLDAGVWGLSTGLEYTPSRYAGIPELSELTKLVAVRGGMYASHLRNEGDTLEEAVAEAIEIGERSGAAVQLSHHKAEGRQNWGKVHKTLKQVEEARARGLDVQLDQYPYTAFQTSLAVQTLPGWANDGDTDAILARIADPDLRAKMVSEILAAHPDWDDLGVGCYWESVAIGASRQNRSLQGKTVADIARERGGNPVEVVLDVLVECKNFVSAVNFAICEEDIATIMSHPYTMIGSDAVGTSPFGKMSEDRVHPRSYGTFPRVLARYVRHLGLLSEAVAIRKMTSMAADRMNIPKRGYLRESYFADITVYDPAHVQDVADFQDSHRFAVGIEHVFVNGRQVWASGAHTGARPGLVLRKNA